MEERSVGRAQESEFVENRRNVAPRRVATCVITGFLGSGKTTLLRGLLDRDPASGRIAVIVNEVGEIGIDGRVLTGFEFVENVVELASGCVCCSIDEYRFDLAIEELLRRVRPTLLVLETTGVADPGPTLERLRRCGLGIDAVVTVVDAKAWATAWRVSSAARRQIAAADFVVISKSELVGARALDRLRRRIARHNPRALVLQGAGARPFAGSDLLLATSAAGRRHGDEQSPPQFRRDDRISGALVDGDEAEARVAADLTAASDHLRDDGIESFSWQAAGAVDRGGFETVIQSLPPTVLRAKGFLRDGRDGRAWLFQLVCGRYEISALEGGSGMAEGAQAVFLGPGVAGLREETVARLESCRLRAEG